MVYRTLYRRKINRDRRVGHDFQGCLARRLDSRAFRVNLVLSGLQGLDSAVLFIVRGAFFVLEPKGNLAVIRHFQTVGIDGVNHRLNGRAHSEGIAGVFKHQGINGRIRNVGPYGDLIDINHAFSGAVHVLVANLVLAFFQRYLYNVFLPLVPRVGGFKGNHGDLAVVNA